MNRSESYLDSVLIGDPEQFRKKLVYNLYSLGYQLISETENTLDIEKAGVRVRIEKLRLIPEKTGHNFHYNINAASSTLRPNLVPFLFLCLIVLIFCIAFPVLFIILFFLFFLLIFIYFSTKSKEPDLKSFISEIDREIYVAAQESLKDLASVPPPDLPQLKNSGPFSHGIEREYAIVTRMGKMHRDIAGNATNAFKKIIERIPLYYTLPNVDERGFRLIWRDEAYPTQLEISTRVCHNLDDIEKELTHLVKLSVKTVKESGYNLIASGAHPFEEPNFGEFFSEHHHIGATDNKEKIWIYNMIRNFIPEIMALTVNSPILLGNPCGVKSIRMDVRNPNIGPIDGVPYLTDYDFLRTAELINKSDARLMDVTPFSRKPTVEVRIMDNQISIERSVAIAAILEALAFKARKILNEGNIIPGVSQEVLARNREAALTHGLSAIFNVDNNIKLAYHGSGKQKIKAFEAVEEMLKFIFPELCEIGATNKHIIPIIASLKLAKAGKGGTLADWQLQRFRSLRDLSESEYDFEKAFLSFLISESSLNPGGDPICRMIDVSEKDIVEIFGKSLGKEDEKQRENCPICGSDLDSYTKYCTKCKVRWI
ncbi:MAG: glutamate-cysteine ligase family protein [Thermoproteota archaeon]